MPIRGKPERPHTSGDQGLKAEGLDDARGFDFLIVTEFESAPFLQFGVGAVFADVGEIELPVSAVFADRKQVEFSLGAEFVDRDGTELQRELFAVSAEFGGSAGYPASGRISVPGQVSIGQRVQRRGEVIPTAD